MDIQKAENPFDTNNEGLSDSRRTKSWVMWAIGGLPIFLTFLQTPFAVANQPAVNVPVVGAIASYLRSFAFLDQVAIIFYESSTIIAVLFIVITLAWLGQGVALAKEMDRKFVWGAAGAASLFFFVLFFGVYWSLSPFVESQFPVAQRMAFFIIPFGASGAVLAAALLNPNLANEIINILSDAESEIKEYRRDFESTIDDTIGQTTLEELGSGEYTTLQNHNTEVDLDEILSIDISATEDPLSDHLAKIQDIESAIEDVKDFDEATESVLEEAKKVRALVRTLESPSEIIKEPHQKLRKQLKDSIGAILQSELEGFESLYGESYRIKNLGNEWQTIELHYIGGSTSVANGATYFEDLLDDTDRDIKAIIKDFQAIIQRIDDIDELIESEHESLQNQIGEINDTLSTYEEWVEPLDAGIQDEIENIFSDGNSEAETVNKQAINEKIKTAETHHYECQFDDQDRTLEKATEEANLLVNIIEYVSTLASSAQSGTTGRSFQIPTFADETRTVLTDTTIEHLDNAFKKNYGIELQQESNRLRLISAGETTEAFDDEEVEPTTEVSESTTSPDLETESMSDGLITDGVNTLLGRIPQIIEERDTERPDKVGDNHLSITSDQLPSLVTNQPVLKEFQTLLDADSDVEKVETNAEGDQVMIKITLEETGATMEDVIKNTKRRFNNE